MWVEIHNDIRKPHPVCRQGMDKHVGPTSERKEKMTKVAMMMPDTQSFHRCGRLQRWRIRSGTITVERWIQMR